MNIKEFFKLILRHKISIIICILLCSISGYLYAEKKQQDNLNSNIFITFSVQNSLNSSSNENLQASDQITETIQGWFKDPALINEIKDQSKLNFGITAKKQEKNNLQISFESNDLISAQIYEKQIINSLKTRINSYNQNSDFLVKLGLENGYHQTIGNITIIYLALSSIIGFILGVMIVYFYEVFSDKFLSKSEIKNSINYSHENSKLILSLINSRKSNKVQFIQLFSNTKNSTKHLYQDLSLKEKDLIIIDKNIEQLKEQDSVYLVSLGKTTKTQYESVKTISGKPLLTIVI